MSLLGGLLELVEVSEGADHGLDAELIREELGLLSGADVEGEVELLEQLGVGENLTEECTADVAWKTLLVKEQDGYSWDIQLTGGTEEKDGSLGRGSGHCCGMKRVLIDV